MGASASSQKQKSWKLRPREADWPYTAAIRDRDLLDWKRHVPGSPEERSEKILEIERLQRSLPVKVSDGLYLSDANGAMDINRMRSLGITHVLNVAGLMGSRIPNEVYAEVGISHRTINTEDEVDYPILERHLLEAREFIAASRKDGGACLVHCMAGINRSGVIVAAEKMLSEQKNVLEVVLECRTSRGNCFLSTNPGFHHQLVALARRENLLGKEPGEPGCIVGCQQWREWKIKNGTGQ